MRILALDPGKSTGWAVLTPDGQTCGTESFAVCEDIGHLVHEWSFWIGSMLDKHEPDVVAVERAFGRSAFTSDLPLILVGVTHAAAHCRGIPRQEWTASALKKRIAGSGKATKTEMKAAIRSLGFQPDSDHAADAAACAMATAGHGDEPVRAPGGPR